MLDVSGIVIVRIVSIHSCSYWTSGLISCTWLPQSHNSITVTRTMPVGNGGKFTEEAKKVYELVLRMQSVSHHFAFLRPAYQSWFV